MKRELITLLTAATVLAFPHRGMAQAAPAAAPAASPSSSASAKAADGDPIGKAQSVLASKTAAFGTVSASDPAVARALEAHSLADAQKQVGKAGAFQGTVSQAYSPDDHDIVILDFDKKYKTALTAVVMPADYAKFPDLAALNGKHVLVSGTWSAPKGKPQITLTSPAQVKIIQ